MTCIAGIAHEGKVYIGADSAGCAGYDLSVRADRKVFTNGPFLMGFTSSFRMGQLLRYAMTPPQRFPDRDVMAFMAVDFIDAVRGCLKAGGFARREAEAEQGGCFLVGYAGRLFEVSSDYQVGEATAGFAAVGCGAPYAMGAMFANARLTPDERIAEALRAAEAHSGGVRAPFHIESTTA